MCDMWVFWLPAGDVFMPHFRFEGIAPRSGSNDQLLIHLRGWDRFVLRWKNSRANVDQSSSSSGRDAR